jgi:hypothetical protein
MTINLKEHIDRLTALRKRLQARANKFWENAGFKNTSESIELVDMWGKIKDITQEVENLRNSIESSERGIKEVPESAEVLRQRLSRDLKAADRKLKSALRIEKQATQLLSTIGTPAKPKEEKKEPPKKPEPEKKPLPPKEEPVKQAPPASPTPIGNKSYNDILKLIKKSVSKFNRNIPAAQRSMFDAIDEQLKRLDIYDDGRVKTTAKNLSILASIKNKMLRVLVTPEYRGSVKEFAKAFNELTTLTNEYWKTQEANFKPRRMLFALRKQAVSDTVNKLMESGIGVNVGDRITSLIKTSITTGGSYKKLTAQLRDGLLNTEQKGYLDRYAKQVSVDSLNQYAAQYNNIVSSDLGYEWFKYDNTLIETSRPFCQAMREEREYFHISEVPGLLKADDLYYDDEGVRKKVPINPKTKLPDGFIPGTNVDTFFVNRAGFFCGHQIRPVNERQVPQSIKDRVFATSAYKTWKASTGKK